MIYPILALALIVIALLVDTLLLKTWVICSKSTWLTLVTMFILTLIFDRILVGLPIVTYTPSTLSGIYFSSIPIEDFSYTFVAVIISLSFQSYLRS